MLCIIEGRKRLGSAVSQRSRHGAKAPDGALQLTPYRSAQ